MADASSPTRRRRRRCAPRFRTWATCCAAEARRPAAVPSIITTFPDQPPASYGTPWYGARNYSFNYTDCPDSELPYGTPNNYGERLCYSEQELIDGVIRNLAYYPCDGVGDCSARDFVVVGDYTDPTVYGGRFSYPTNKKIKYTRVYTSGQRVDDYYSLFMEQPFTCAAGFYPLEAQNVLTYPNVCRSDASAYISKNKTQQKQPCSECNPSSGDEARAEADFTFGGVPFVRHYHSLREVSFGESLVGVGWTHSYAARVSAGYSSVVTREGYVQDVQSAGDGTYIATGSSRAVVRYVESSDATVMNEDGGWVSTHARGVLRSIVNPQDASQGVWLQYDYGLSGTYRLWKAVDSAGRVVTFRYGAGDRLAAVDLPDGRQINYGYDDENNLVSVDYGNGQVKRYHYGETELAPSGERNLLTGITSEDGTRYASFGYDVYGRVKSSELSGPYGAVQTTRVHYTGANEAQVETASGETRSYVYQSGSDRMPLRVSDASGSVSHTYDGYGHVSSTTDARGVLTQFGYSAGRLSQRIDAANDASGNKRTVQTDWNIAVNQPAERRTLDANGNIVSKQTWSYNARGQVLVSTVTDPVAAVSRSSTSTYCEQADVDAGSCPRAGLLTKVDGPRTDVSDITTYPYRMADAVGCDTAPTTCAYRKGDLWKVTNAKGQVAETLAYDGAGRPLSVKDANGVITDFEYNARGWLTASKVRGTGGSSESDDVVTRMDYFPTGLVQTITQPDGTSTSFEYDAAHRLTAIANNIGDRIEYTLDNAGNRTKEDTKDAQGYLRRTLSRVYNQLGQLTAANDAYGYATGMTYDASGNTDTVQDAKSRVVDNDYDPLSRLTRTLQDTTGIRADTKFGYDALDNLTSVVDPKGLTTGYTYNGLGDLTQLVSPDTGTTTYTYDSAGNLKTKLDARGSTKLATYAYDVLNRLTGISYATTGPNLNVTYAYDTVNSVCGTTEAFAIGRLTKMTDGSGSTQYCYDRFGRMVRKVQTTNGKVFTTAYQYAVSGQLLAMTYPSGLRVDYAHDAAGRPNNVKVTRPGQVQESLLSNVAYYPFGPVAELHYGNEDRVLTRQYDKNYRPVLVQDSTAAGLHYLLGWDEVGNLTGLSDTASNPNISVPLRSYVYDGLNRLTAANDPSNVLLQGYSYDATGNRLSDTKVTGTGTTAYTYPATSHQLTKVGTVARTYDAMGNMLTGTVNGVAKTFTYDVTGRMNVAKNGSTVQMNYAYNGKGEQVRRYPTATSTAQTYEVYDEAGHWIGEYDSTGARKQEFIWLGDLPIGVYAPSPGSTTAYQVYQVQADHLGTPRAVIDATRQKAVWSWPLQNEAFGKSNPVQDPDADGKTFVLDMRFPGQRYDGGSGLNYNYHRHYEAGTGKYTQPDPIGLAGGINDFAYVSGNPLKFIDPTGLIVTVVCRAVDDWRVHWSGAKHCGVFVWHWEYEGCSDRGKTKKVIDRQFSLAANRVPFPQNSKKPTFAMDRDAFNWSGDSISQYDIQPPNGMTNAAWDSAVINSGDNFSLDSDYSAFFGPNSNTATDNIIENAGGLMPDIPGARHQDYGD